MSFGISNIDFKVLLSGRGVVNRDSESVAKRYAFHEGATIEKNQSFAKTSITAKLLKQGDEEDGERKKYQYERKTKISKNLLRNQIFVSEQPYQTSHLLANLTSSSGSNYLPKMVSSFAHIVRGFLYARDGSNAYKRKSPLMISDAIQTNDELLKLEVGASSGIRTDTSFYFFDQAGDLKYEAIGSLDLVELGFISCDPLFDRQAFNSDNYEEVVDLLQSRLGLEPSPEMKHYRKIGSEVIMGERGMILSHKDCLKLAIMTFERIQKIFIKRTSGYAKTDAIQLVLTEANGIPFNFEKNEYTLNINRDTDVAKELSELFSKNNQSIARGYEIADTEEIEARDGYEKILLDKKSKQKESDNDEKTGVETKKTHSKSTLKKSKEK